MVPKDNWFDSLYSKFFENMAKFAKRRLYSEPIAIELVQDVFELLWSDRENLKEHPNIAGWLYTTLNNLICNKVRSSEFKRERPMTEHIADLTDTVSPYTYQIPLADALPSGLTDREKNLLIWFFDDELSYEQIAARLEISVEHCRVLMYRVKLKCKVMRDAE